MVSRARKLESSSSLTITEVEAFEQWALASHIAKQFDLKFLKDRTIGIDAAHFLRTLPQEALLSALGGAPLALDTTVSSAVTVLHNAGLNLHFVFSGLESGVEDDLGAKAAYAARLNNEAFNLYEGKQLAQAYKSFDFSSKEPETHHLMSLETDPG